MKIAGRFIVNAVTVTRDLSGEELGPVRKVLTLEGLLPVDDLAELFATTKDRDAFDDKYWDRSGNLVIAALTDAVTVDQQIEGGRASVNSSLGQSEPIRFEGVDVKRIRLTPQAGRQVAVKFALHLYPDLDQRGRLDGYLREEVSITAECAQAELELVGGRKGRKPKPEPQSEPVDGLSAENDPLGLESFQRAENARAEALA